MLVLDTSAYINGRRDHLMPGTFPSVWKLVEEALADGRIILPREVFRELVGKDDDTATWIKSQAAHAIDPSEGVQRRAGVIYTMFPGAGRRDGADPFVLAEAELRGFTVVTYEGRSFAGVPTKRWDRTMPGICSHVGITCATLPEGLAILGASF